MCVCVDGGGGGVMHISLLVIKPILLVSFFDVFPSVSKGSNNSTLYVYQSHIAGTPIYIFVVYFMVYYRVSQNKYVLRVIYLYNFCCCLFPCAVHLC